MISCCKLSNTFTGFGDRGGNAAAASRALGALSCRLDGRAFSPSRAPA
jgi:hypothetical protein